MIRMIQNIGFAFLLVLYLLVGCGTQDRYQVTEPAGFQPIEISEWATLTPVQALWNSTFSSSSLVIQDHSPVFFPDDNLVYRATSEGFQVMPTLPKGIGLRAAISGPEGELWVGGRNGKVLRLQDGTWQTEKIFSKSIAGMLLDHQGRVVVYGWHGLLSTREPDGQWFQQDFPDSIHISKGWCDFGRPPVLVTTDLRLLVKNASGWQLGEPLIDEYIGYPREIQGSEDGRLVICLNSSHVFLIQQGSDWQRVETDYGVDSLFWLDNELFGVSMVEKNLLQWDGEQWNYFLSLEGWAERGFSVQTIPWDQNRFLSFENGMSLVFDGSEFSLGTPALGSCAGQVEFAGARHQALSKGLHLMESDGIWHEVGRPLGQTAPLNSDHFLVADEHGVPTFLGQYRLVTWDGTSYQEYVQEERFRKFFQQPDGRLLLISQFKVGLWDSGEVIWLGEHGESLDQIRGVSLEPGKGVWVVANNHLKLVEPDHSSIRLTFQGWEPENAVFDPQRGLVCFGRDRLIVFNDPQVLDLTPHWPSGHEAEVSRVFSLLPDGLGGWLAADSRADALLRFDGERWLALDHSFWTSIWGDSSFRNLFDGRFLFQNGEEIYLLELK